MEIIRKGKYYQIYTIYISGIKHYFVGKIKDGIPLMHGGTVWSYLNKEQAYDIFNHAEKERNKIKKLGGLSNDRENR